MTTLFLLIALTAQPSAMIEAADAYPGVRFHEGVRDPLLVELAEGGAKLLAERDEAGYWSNGAPAHPSWDERFGRIRKELGMSGAEVTAMARPGEGDDIGREVFYDWQRSSGHWNVVSKPHARYGEALAKSKSNVWFACVICAD